MIMRIFFILSFMVLAGTPYPAALADTHGEPAQLAIKDAYAHATTPVQKSGALFLTVTNPGILDDRLIAAAAPVSETTEIHTTLMEGDMMMMRKVDFIDVPHGETVSLTPQGYHVMLIGLHAPLEAGGTLPVTLTFARAGTVEVKAAIRPVYTPQKP